MARSLAQLGRISCSLHACSKLFDFVGTQREASKPDGTRMSPVVICMPSVITPHHLPILLLGHAAGGLRW